MAVQLFLHNRQAYDAMTAMLEKMSKAAIIHPTGTGKSFIAFKWVEDHPGKRFLWLSPSEYIYKTQLENVTWSDAEYPAGQITFMTYARLMMMTDEEIAALEPYGIVLDEFHRCGSKCWGEGVARLLGAFPEALLLGLSATKIRYLDGQRDMAQELFEGCVASEMTLGEAVVRGILPAPKYVTTIYRAQRELEGLQKRIDAVGQDALRAQCQRHMDALRAALENADGLPAVFARHMKDKTGKYLIFCSNETHMRRMAAHAGEWFGEIDPDMHVYTAYSADPETSRALKAFVEDDSEHLKLLFSINMLNEGVHVRGVSGVILFRQTVSPIIYKQQIGRVLTAGMQKTPLILDVVNNFDGLSSYGSIRTEMNDAVQRLRREGRADGIRVERLEVIEQMHDATRLFERLERSLSTTWDFYYEAASSYYAEHGNLKVNKRYVTPEGLQLGVWIQTQRGLYQAGDARLSCGQIERLEAIGMIWEDKASLAWMTGYAHARAFYEENGHLDVEAGYACADGYKLGAWIRRMRQQKNGSVKNTMLDADRIRQLEQIGMRWNVMAERWETGFCEAERFARENGHLNVPGEYISPDGFALGRWIVMQRQAKQGRYGRTALSAEQCARLEDIGMQWSSPRDIKQKEAFNAAKLYFETHGDLQIPVTYETPEGIKLGAWIRRQRDRWKAKGQIDEAMAKRLSGIGVIPGKSTAD